MNKKTKVVPFIKKLEFMVGNSLFSIRGDKIETVFEIHSGYKVSPIRLNMEILTPSLWLDASVVDCWGVVLNHEESFKEVGSPSRHFFPNDCITEPMIDGSLDSEGQWKSFEGHVSAHFKDNVVGVSLKDVNLVIEESYDKKYKGACDVLKNVFSRHLQLYGNKRYASIIKLKPKTPKLKWRTKSNFRDCGIFAMLHMESFMGEAATKWNCSLIAESKLQFDMLRRLRFKFSTKMLLHELNVHREKMLQEAKEFDKIDSATKINIIVEAVKNMNQREEIEHISMIQQ